MRSLGLVPDDSWPDGTVDPSDDPEADDPEPPDDPLPELLPVVRSLGLIFPEDSACPRLSTESCRSPCGPEPPELPPFPSVTLGGVPPLECCASDGSPVKASKPPVIRTTASTGAVFMMSSFDVDVT